MKSNEIVSQIKADLNLSLKDLFLSVFLISRRISPYFSVFFIKKGTSPNKITIYMIISGICGALLFMIPNIYIKIIGALFIHLWMVLDCSDGEVARYTKNFSKFGKELDYMAHLINHPLFGFSLFISLVQFNKYSIYTLAILVLLSNFLDYLNRNLYTLGILKNLKLINEEKVIDNSWSIKKVIRFIASIFTVYPNLILFGVIIYFIDYLMNTNILIIYLLCNVGITFLFSIKDLFYLTKNFYRL